MQPGRWVLLALFWILPARAELRPDDNTPLGYRLPLVLIHGWNADPSTFDDFARQYAAHPLAPRRLKLYRFGYDWRRSIAASAELLRRDLAAQLDWRGRPAVLVGHSMGGLVARSYVESRLPGYDGLDRVGLVITLATPHHGSPTANLEWIAGDSRFSLLAKLMPVGLLDLLGNIPIFAAVRTDGGHNLGWDNSDRTMPASLWSGADRYLERLNADLAVHPQRDELLLRYRLYAGYLATVPALSVPNLVQRVRQGDHYGAGCALLAHAFRDEQGEAIERWALNDGVVPLESACFLQPGAEVFDRADGRVQVNLARIRERSLRPGLVASVQQGVDHSAIVRDPRVVADVLAAAAAYEPNAVAAVVDGQLVLRRPGGPARPWGQLNGRVAAGLAADRLLLARADGTVELANPSGRQVFTRSPLLAAQPDSATPRPGSVAANGSALATRFGWLLRLREPGGLELARGDPQALWSPDGGRLAYVADDGRLMLLDATTWESRPATLAGEALPAGLQPTAWTADGQRLLACANEALLSARFQPGSNTIAMLAVGGSTVTGRLLDRDGAQQSEFTQAVAAGGTRLILRDEAGTQELAELPAGRTASLIWAADGGWLAWTEPAAIGVRAGAEVKRIATDGAPGPLTLLADGRLLTCLRRDGGAFTLVRVEPVGGAMEELAGGVGGERASLSPDGRYALVDMGSLLVVALDGSGSETWPGSFAAWLPLPAHERWTAGGPDPG